MGKKKKNKKMRYKSFGSVLGIDTTFIQAAVLLDKVSKEAYDANNTEMMMQVATSWLQLGALMHGVIGHDDEEKPDSDEDSGAAILGFGNTEAREKAEAENRARKS